MRTSKMNGNNIPHIIHYCWFGPKQFSELEKRCLESWKRYMPDYELRFWNENTFDIKKSEFAKQAYEMRKYAFVSDYVRVKVLRDYGGVYFDTDFELFQSINEFVKNGNFLGFETRSHIGTAIMAFQPHHYVMSRFLDYYDNHTFLDNKGRADVTANVSILTDILIPMGLRNDNTRQMLGDINIYPREFFYPKRITESTFKMSNETVGCHRCSNSWMTESQKRRGTNAIWVKICRPVLNMLRKLLRRIAGRELTRKVEIIIRNVLG